VLDETHSIIFTHVKLYRYYFLLRVVWNLCFRICH